jgi:hypothetical protein
VDQAIRPLQIGTLDSSGLVSPVQNIAFHGDLNSGGIPHITTCRLEKPEHGLPTYKEYSYDKGNVLIHDCDIIGGASGGPFVITDHGKDYLVAINQGFYQAYSLPGNLRNVFLPGVVFNVAVAANTEMIRSVKELADRREVLGTIRKREATASPQQTSIQRKPAPSSSLIAERLRTLQSLLDKGLITKEEAELKRRQILKDL